jgi:hypothetical protein
MIFVKIQLTRYIALDFMKVFSTKFEPVQVSQFEELKKTTQHLLSENPDFNNFRSFVRFQSEINRAIEKIKETGGTSENRYKTIRALFIEFELELKLKNDLAGLNLNQPSHFLPPETWQEMSEIKKTLNKFLYWTQQYNLIRTDKPLKSSSKPLLTKGLKEFTNKYVV